MLSFVPQAHNCWSAKKTHTSRVFLSLYWQPFRHSKNSNGANTQADARQSRCCFVFCFRHLTYMLYAHAHISAISLPHFVRHSTIFFIGCNNGCGLATSSPRYARLGMSPRSCSSNLFFTRFARSKKLLSQLF